MHYSHKLIQSHITNDSCWRVNGWKGWVYWMMCGMYYLDYDTAAFPAQRVTCRRIQRVLVWSTAQMLVPMLAMCTHKSGSEACLPMQSDNGLYQSWCCHDFLLQTQRVRSSLSLHNTQLVLPTWSHCSQRGCGSLLPWPSFASLAL